MPTEFTMPKLGLTMEEGTIVEWLVRDGDEVADGHPVMVIQTDKVETEVNVVGGGRLHQMADVGTTLSCGETVGLLLGADEQPPTGVETGRATPPAATTATVATATVATETGSAVPAAQGDAEATPTPSAEAADVMSRARRFVSPNARRVAAELGVDLAAVRGTGPGGRIVSEDVDAVATAAPTSATAPATEPGAAAAPAVAPPPQRRTSGHVPATFAARSLADLLGVDITDVAPDGREQRVAREDVARHVRTLLAGQPTGGDAHAGRGAPAATQAPSSVIPMRGMRATIAKRMHASLREMAQLTLTMDADADAVVADRAARRAEGIAPGYTDYVIAATARALRDHPGVNAQITAQGVALLPDVHVGIAVALDGGLVVPVVRHADRRSVADIAADTTRLAEAARSGGLTLDELEGGTFSVSALGMFGVDAFTPVINPPNVAILGVGRLRDALVLDERGVRNVKRMTLSLTWDHRAFDGAPAAEFTQSIVHHLAHPNTFN